MNHAVNKTFGAFGKGIKTLAGPLAGLAPAFGIAGIIEFADRSIQAFQESQAALANVEAGLKSTGNAIGITGKQFSEMAARAQEVGIFEDDTIMQNATAQLLTFGSIGKNNFERVQNAAMDVAAKLNGVAVTGENLKGISIMMGKAMDDPVRGMGAMRKAGLQFDQQQENMIKTMALSGNKHGAQVLMLKEIERLYGGTSVALGKTDKGMEIIAKNKMGDTMENIGEQLAPIKAQLFEMALFILPAINKALPTFFKWVKKLFPAIVAVGIAMVAFKVATWAVIFAQGVMTTAGWVKYLFMMRSVIMGAIVHTKLWAAAQWLVNTAMSLNPISLIIIAIAALGYAIYDLYNNWDAYVLGSSIWFADMILGFKAVKMEVYELLNALGMVSNEKLAGAQQEWVMALKTNVGLRLKQLELNTSKEGIDNKTAPNATEAEGKYSNSTTVNVNNALPGTTANVTPRATAKVNFSMMGLNP
jgi:hypothetical protein